MFGASSSSRSLNRLGKPQFLVQIHRYVHKVLTSDNEFGFSCSVHSYAPRLGFSNRPLGLFTPISGLGSFI